MKQMTTLYPSIQLWILYFAIAFSGCRGGCRSDEPIRKC
mgnify:CR=1 FL=1